jgi:hypothetical protein
MMPMDVPPHSWHTIGADIFHFKGKLYVLLSDYFSKMPFVRQINNTSAAATIKAVKSVISENGIPYKMISDNNPFKSREFTEFARKYGFTVVSSSPEYPRGHGLIERHIQTIKKCMYKCEKSGQDFDLALLSLRSTPLDSHLPSPAELLNGRKFRTTLPSMNQNASTTDTQVREHFESRQAMSKGYYDQHTRQKDELSQNQPVRVYNKDSRTWDPATITEFADTPRSYIVQRGAGGRPLRRNRQHVKPTNEQWPNGAPPMDPLEDFDPFIEEDDGRSNEMCTGDNAPPQGTTGQEVAQEQPVAPEGPGNVGRRYPERVRNKPVRYR